MMAVQLDEEMKHDQLPSVEEVKNSVSFEEIERKGSGSVSKNVKMHLLSKARSLKKEMIAIIFLASTVFGLAITVGVLASNRQQNCPYSSSPGQQSGQGQDYRDEEDQYPPGQVPYSPPQDQFVKPVEMQSIISYAMEKKGIVRTSSEYKFEEATPQMRALLKVMEETVLTKPMAIQRYALWAFYYATEKVGTPVTEEVFGYGTVPRWADSWYNDGPDPCLWYGIRCNSDGAVVELNLDESHITGVIPVELRLLDSLTKLSLGDNRGLGYGGVPLWLKDMDSLQFIDLRGCSFSGEVPLELCDSTASMYAECSSCSCCNRCYN